MLKSGIGVGSSGPSQGRSAALGELVFAKFFTGKTPHVMRKGECRMSFRRAGCLVVLAVTSVLLFTVNAAECITIKPAAFDRILANVPEEVMAGVEFEVAVTFVDRYGNLMAENWKPETSLTLNVSQAASVQQSIRPRIQV